jgi:predicted unusual protein kinase regulating ubiquinone biosynthesis (AarF/ABC1/UbiB family)
MINLGFFSRLSYFSPHVDIFHVLCFYLCHFPVVWFWVLTVFPVTKIVNACFFGSLTVLEGIALSTDPNYKVLSSSYPWIARKVLTDKSPQLQSTLRSLLYKDGSFRIDRLESLMTEAMRSQMENPEDLEGLEERKGSTSEGDARNLVKRILTFALTEQVRNWFNAL